MHIEKFHNHQETPKALQTSITINTFYKHQRVP